jgi:hypothetical protein
LWKARRAETDLYLAGVGADRVLIVGSPDCRALRLDDGVEVWRQKTGVPSGQGVVCAGVFCLPLKTAAEEKKPAVYALDVGTGAILRREVAVGDEGPGNLLFCGPDVFSQTPTTLTAYAGTDSVRKPPSGSGALPP